MLDFIYPHLNNEELIARVADVLWQQRRRRAFGHAKVAIASYLARAKGLEAVDSWPRPFKRLRRAFQLAQSIGSSNPELHLVETYSLDLLRKLGVAHKSFYVEALADLLFETERSEEDKLSVAQLCEGIAQRADVDSDYERARRYYRASSKWYRRLQMMEDVRRVEIARGEAYVTEAQQREAIVRPMLLSKAVVALRDAGVEGARLSEVRRLQAIASKGSLSEMTTIEESLDLSTFAEKSRDRAKGLTAQAGLTLLANVNGIPTINNLRKAVDEQMAIAPLRHLFSTQTVDDQGRVLGVRGPALTRDPLAAAEAIESEMARQATIEWQLIVYGVVLPFVDTFTSENRISLEELVEFVSDRPFVPAGRELIISRGLQFGFHGDFATAALDPRAPDGACTADLTSHSRGASLQTRCDWYSRFLGPKSHSR